MSSTWRIVLTISLFLQQVLAAPQCSPRIVVVTVEEPLFETTTLNLLNPYAGRTTFITSTPTQTTTTPTIPNQVPLTTFSTFIKTTQIPTTPYQLPPTSLSTFVQTTSTLTTPSQSTLTILSTTIQTTTTPTTPSQSTTTTLSTSTETPNSVTTPQVSTSTSSTTTSSPPRSTTVTVDDARARCGNNQIISCCNTKNKSGGDGGLLGGLLGGVLGGDCDQLPLIGILNLPLNQACGNNEVACCTGDSSGLINVQCNMLSL